MLVVTEDAIGLKVAYDATVHDTFQNLACYGCQRDWSIVTSLMFITLFEDGDDVGFPPIFGYWARIQPLCELNISCTSTTAESRAKIWYQ